MKEPTVTLSTEPFVGLYERFWSHEECQYVINLAKERLAPAQSQDGYSESRTSDVAWIGHFNCGTIYSLCNRIAETIDQPLNHAEHLQAARYLVGGKFDQHVDCYNLNSEGGKYFYSLGGQRLYTAILYLNTTLEGGQTFFPHLDLNITPTEGNLLVFENCYSGTNNPHPHSLHGSSVLEKGEKWIATLWFCERER
ncbi:prolyl 4-hydroxylase [Croceifilum oryzae]|uniref:Prolyl 4-hydroxylase n=1 Tax=Croceifilum oryzae TaxID=1553429 RepID=A0AAJ1TKZ5_9BACL|nr:2OG-Fe(II) oxygenase [Croceifilum oryzae]MDQ0416550.1 prolyl 4-hydroxylase [Croceifilum oryzae]